MAAQPRPGPDGRRWEGAAVGVLFAGVAALDLWAWSSGQLAAWLATGRWLHVGVSVGLAVVTRLPSRLADPAAAWPAAVRAGLPGSPLLLTTLAVTAAGGAASAVIAGRLVARRRRLHRHGLAGPACGPRPPLRRQLLGASPGARWATARDLRPLAVRGAQPGRLVLGRAGRRLVATESRQSVLVLGPTQSGKTTGLAVPAALEWDGPLVATSVKGDLMLDTLAWRRRCGRCWVFDPTGATAAGAADGWSPLAEAADWSGAQRVAGWMVEATPARAGLDDGAFWYAAAAKLLAPLLLAARTGGATMADVVRWTDTGALAEPATVLEGAGETGAATALDACAARDERIRSSVSTTLETVLAPFEDPVVAARTARCTIDPAALLAGSHSLYLCGPVHEQARVQGLFASLVSSVVAAAVARAGQLGGPLDPPLLLVLDEAANIAPVRDLDTLASTAAGFGIQLVTVVQDLSQLAARYGADRSRTIANNHRAKLALSGVGDLATLDMLSGLAGEAAVREESFTADLRDGRRTRSSSVAYRRLAPADELRRIRPGTAVLVYGHLPAARLTLRPWFADRALRRRAAPAA